MFGLTILKDKSVQVLKEAISTYERTLEDIGWINMTIDPFSSDSLISGGFEKVLKRCKIYYYNNPLAGHWVHLTTAFVFGEGVATPKAKEESIQEIVDKFWDDPDNKKTLTGFQGQQLLSNKVQYEGNLFFLLFEDIEADIKVRMLNTEEVVDIIYDPDDRNRPLFYKVKYVKKEYNFRSDSYEMTNQKYVYYADKDNFNPKDYAIPTDKLMENVRVFHVKTNCDINDKFGVPELYRGIDWMEAHKNMMGDIATLVKSLSKFAWDKKVKGTPAQTRTIAGKLAATTDLSSIRNTAGQNYVHNDGIEMKSVDVKSGGVQIGVDAGRQMKLMTCAASGIFEHYFGDPSSGNLATAKTMEAPMVRKFANYQSLWTSIFLAILNYQIDRKIAVGSFPGEEEEDPISRRITYTTVVDRSIDVDFPPVLEADIKATAEAMGMGKDKGLVSDETASQHFILAMNLNNVDEEVEKAMEDAAKRKEEQQAQFEMGIGMAAENKGSSKEDPKKKKPPPAKSKDKKDIKEAIDTPAKNTGRGEDRLVRKNNFLGQKLNGYRKALASHFNSMRTQIKEDTKVSVKGERATGDVPNLDLIIHNFAESMQNTAKIFFPVAVAIGEKYAQSELRKMGVLIQETVYEVQGRADGVLREALSWNEDYISNSLAGDMTDKIGKAVKQPYANEAAYREAVNKSVNLFESRVELYVGAFWNVEEKAVKEAASGAGAMANYAGPLDEITCPGCRDAVENNPYPVENCPVPGSFESRGRCRHAIQLINPKEGE